MSSFKKRTGNTRSQSFTHAKDNCVSYHKRESDWKSKVLLQCVTTSATTKEIMWLTMHCNLLHIAILGWHWNISDTRYYRPIDSYHLNSESSITIAIVIAIEALAVCCKFMRNEMSFLSAPLMKSLQGHISLLQNFSFLQTTTSREANQAGWRSIRPRHSAFASWLPLRLILWRTYGQTDRQTDELKGRDFIF